MSVSVVNGNVWILGAGFSKPLGGPLLDDLMRPALETRLLRLHSERADEDVRAVHRAYAGWTHLLPGQAESGHRSARCPWGNPEEFVAMVQRAAMDPPESPLRAAIELGAGVQGGQIQALADRCVRYLAIATDYFVPPPSVFGQLEQSRPYREWAKQLADRDTVITFNYDRVVEEARGNLGVAVAVPDDPRTALPSGLPRLLKLHGSVTFTEGDANPEAGGVATKAVLSTAPTAVSDALAEGRVFLIGVPGPSKLQVSERLSHAWKAAEEALEVASTVTFIGYRFAETDDEAKRRILKALGRNKNPTLTVRVVLGLPNDHGRRVLELVRWALRERTVWSPEQVPHGYRPSAENSKGAVVELVPFYAQDYLTIAERPQWNHWWARA